MPKQSESEVPLCVSTFCPHMLGTHNVGASGCNQPVIALTPEQRRVWHLQPLGALVTLQQNHGRIRLQCECGSYSEDFALLRHSTCCAIARQS